MSHSGEVHSPEVCSAGFLLPDLSIEILGSVFALVGSNCLGRLVLAGDHRLHAKLAQQYVVKELTVLVPAGNTKWPSAVSFFPQLHSLVVKCEAHAQYIPLEGFKLEHLSKELRNLQFSFANDFVCFMELDADFADLPPHNSDGLRLIDMDEVLPNLETFEYTGGVKYSELYPRWPSYLPRKLQSIKFDRPQSFSTDMVAILPRTLKEVSLTLGGWSQITEGDIASARLWPNSLESLNLNHSSLSILPSLPSSLTHLTLLGLSTDALFGSTHLWKSLERLPLLNTLSTTCLKLDSTFALILQSLKNLTDLSLSYTDCDPRTLRLLPTSLQRLTLSADVGFGNSTIWHWSLIPKDLTYLDISDTDWDDSSEDSEQWKDIPRGLKNFSLSAASIAPRDIIANANDLPTSVTDLTMESTHTLLSVMAANLQRSVTTLRIVTPHPEIALPFIRDCHLLKSLDLDTCILSPSFVRASQMAPLDSLYCRAIELVSAFDFASHSWTRQLTTLRFHMCISVSFEGPEHFASLPRTLTNLEISADGITHEHFSELPRGLKFLFLSYLKAGITDSSLAMLPPALVDCNLSGASHSLFTIQGLLSLPMTLHRLILSPGRLTYAEYTPFLEQRPYLTFQLNTSSIPQAESIFKEYKQKKLTLGSTRARYETF